MQWCGRGDLLGRFRQVSCYAAHSRHRLCLCGSGPVCGVSPVSTVCPHITSFSLKTVSPVSPVGVPCGTACKELEGRSAVHGRGSWHNLNGEPPSRARTSFVTDPD